MVNPLRTWESMCIVRTGAQNFLGQMVHRPSDRYTARAMQKKRALLSVSDKAGVEDFARRLSQQGYEILSTGGTADMLRKAGIDVTPVEAVTQFPECFLGRVKTLHPLILGGILFRRREPAHAQEAKKLQIQPIDIVAVNLYPFEETMKKLRGGASTLDLRRHHAELIEQIDIGGPTLLRSAAKNHEHVTVVCDPEDYERVLREIEEHGETTLAIREELAAKVFLRTATYDAAITEALSRGRNNGVLLEKRRELRYGENPHQWGKYYERCGSPAGWDVLQEEEGKPLSYLNILDADAAWNAACGFDDPTAVFVKHANPSGIASHEDIAEAFQRAYDADRLSAFGVIIALNRPCGGAIVQKIIDQKMFVEVLIAPAYSADALALLKTKPKTRVIRSSGKPSSDTVSYRSALGGVLVQNLDTLTLTAEQLTCVTAKKPMETEIRDLLFAWKAVKYCRSNAIVLAKDRVTVGIGSGQTSRVDAVWIAAKRAGEKSKGAVMASDAFFPFPDSIEEAAKVGITVIIQPGGSLRDADVIARANELGLAMVTTGMRAFLH